MYKMLASTNHETALDEAGTISAAVQMTYPALESIQFSHGIVCVPRVLHNICCNVTFS